MRQNDVGGDGIHGAGGGFENVDLGMEWPPNFGIGGAEKEEATGARRRSEMAYPGIMAQITAGLGKDGTQCAEWKVRSGGKTVIGKRG